MWRVACAVCHQELSSACGESPVADSNTLRSSRVRDANARCRVSRHYEILASRRRESPVSDSNTLRSLPVRAVKHPVRIGADGVAFWGGAADMNSMRPPFSYRHDPSVPTFADDKPVIIFDGHCALCSGWASFVLRHDRAGR